MDPISYLQALVLGLLQGASELFPVSSHEGGSSHHHIKHGLAAFILGIGAFIFAWFQTGPATTGRSPSTE